MKILVITELRQGKWNNASFETLAAAQQIAKDTNSTISALVIGKGIAAFADELAAKNVAEVLQVEHDLLEAYTPDGFCVALKQVIDSARRVTGHPIPAETHPRRPGHPAFLIASSEKAIAELNWQPKCSEIDEVVRTAWLWHQKRYNN